jgi:hypothetical protein
MYKKLTIILIYAIFFSACNLLEKNSPNDLDASTAIKDGASAEAALLGLYSSMQRDAYYGGSFPLLTEPLCNNASTGGFQVISLTQLGDKEVTPSNLIVEETWIAIYRTIANCNFLLEALTDIADLDQDRAKSIEGQTRALRALAHFDLLRTFGEHWDTNSKFGIPIISRVQTIQDQPVRATVADNYTFIIDELKAAATLVDSNDASVQYMNIHAINALLARAYLYKKDNGAAAESATKVINSQIYTLLDKESYSSLFFDRRSSESIFELSFDNQNRSAFNGLTYSRDEALRTEIFYLAAADLGAFFQTRPDDIRATLLNFSPDNNDATIQPDGRTQKYRGEDRKDSPAYIVRLAEMYLIRAEVNGLAAGLEDLNLLRVKRGLPEVVITDANLFNEAILAERRAEFNFEGLYLNDLARWGQFEVVTGKAAYKQILPVPTREIIASGGKIEQNSGY